MKTFMIWTEVDVLDWFPKTQFLSAWIRQDFRKIITGVSDSYIYWMWCDRTTEQIVTYKWQRIFFLFFFILGALLRYEIRLYLARLLTLRWNVAWGSLAVVSDVLTFTCCSDVSSEEHLLSCTCSPRKEMQWIMFGCMRRTRNWSSSVHPFIQKRTMQGLPHTN